MFSVFFYLVVFSFFCAVHLTSHHIPERQPKKTKNPKSKLQKPDQKRRSVSAQHVCLPTRLPNSFVPKGSNIRTPLTIHFDEKICRLPHIFSCFSCHQSCGVLYGILVHDRSPPRIRTINFLEIHQHLSKMSSWKSPNKVCKVQLINVLFPKNLEQTPRMRWEKKKNGWE